MHIKKRPHSVHAAPRNQQPLRAVTYSKPLNQYQPPPPTLVCPACRPPLHKKRLALTKNANDCLFHQGIPVAQDNAQFLQKPGDKLVTLEGAFRVLSQARPEVSEEQHTWSA
jgi:hypothetical protein